MHLGYGLYWCSIDRLFTIRADARDYSPEGFAPAVTATLGTFSNRITAQAAMQTLNARLPGPPATESPPHAQS